jgi:serine/threonine protein kinase
MNHLRTSIDQVFDEALALAASEERKQFLDAACGDDAALRQRVELLLRAHGEAKSFLETPVVDARALRAEPSCAPGTQVGPYLLLEQIGEGGMGVVYVAQQTEPIRRRVAVKIIKPGMDTRQVIARFEAERQALAMMDHPNIAKVLDAGAVGLALPDTIAGQQSRQAQPDLLTPDPCPLTPASGRPYFVMELVRGLAITDYCDQARLSTRGRLELFMTVCHAVQHAHQKGIIHRDLKPSNVLVTLHDGKPVVKVIDFGVAKATGQSLTERTMYTAFTEMIGTPLYMSPEQAELSGLDIDTRSDVYSLGVLLYELLTGQTPFTRDTLVKAGLDEVRRMIREDEPPRPSHCISTLNADAGSTISQKRGIDQRQLTRTLTGELDWIVMKALEKDRNRRYESASAFAADVERYLNNEPVEASPPSPRYRLWKTLQRNRVMLSTAALVLLALVIGAGLSVWQAVRATRAEARADARSQLARRAVDEMYTEFAEKWLADQTELTEKQRELLEKAASFYEMFASENSADYQIQSDALLAMGRVAAIQQRLGRLSLAETTCRKQLAHTSRLAREYPEKPELQLAVFSAQMDLAGVLRKLGQVRESSELLQLAAKGVNSLNESISHSREMSRLLAEALDDLDRELTLAGHTAEADTAMQQSLAIRLALVESDPSSWMDGLYLARAYSLRGAQLMCGGGRNKEAEVALREADWRFSGSSD